MVEGCYIKLLTAIEENAIIIAGVAIGIAAIEVHQTFYLAYLENIGKGDARLMFQESFFLFYFINVCLRDTRAHSPGQEVSEFLNISSLMC